VFADEIASGQKAAARNGMAASNPEEEAMYETINGIRMAYRDRGRDHETVLLLIHGFPLDSRLWDAQVAGLASRVRVIAPDLRGSGRSDVPPGPYSVDQHAGDLLSLLDHLGIRRAVVGGLSMGGYIAFAIWRRHPERVRALVLADTRAEPDSPQTRAGRDASAARVREIGPAEFAEEMLPRIMAPASMENPRLRSRALHMMAAQSSDGLVGALGALRDRHDSRPLLPGITVPVLVIVGRQDILTPPADARIMAAAIPGARVVEVPGAGHLSPLENPRAVNAALRAFLREVAAA
jgi:3-oxoadipate enol-lactonase